MGSIKGTIKEILSPVTGESNGKPWANQTFILEYQDGTFTKKVAMKTSGKAMEALQSFSGGEVVEAAYSIESREYSGKWYTDVKCWGIRGEYDSQTSGRPSFSPSVTEADKHPDGLPF
jgi:hypothetical protein